jgi:hypothetical protein
MLVARLACDRQCVSPEHIATGRAAGHAVQAGPDPYVQ